MNAACRSCAGNRCCRRALPGIDLAADVALLAQLVSEVNREFGLAPEQIEQLQPASRLVVYRAVAAFGGAMIGRVVTHQLVADALRSVGLRLGAKTVTRFVPLAGQALAAGMAYAAMRYVGRSHIDDCVRVVEAALPEAGVTSYNEPRQV